MYILIVHSTWCSVLTECIEYAIIYLNSILYTQAYILYILYTYHMTYTRNNTFYPHTFGQFRHLRLLGALSGLNP